jgi:F0F1-type ATP synthase assembly protein I
VALALIAARTTERRNLESNQQHDVMRIALATTSAILVALSIGRFWLLPVAIALSLVAWCWQQSTKLALGGLGTVCIGTVALGQSLLRENWWYTQGNDAQYFESISWSLARFGMSENPLWVGNSIKKYHWLIYSFSGTVSEFARAKPWQTITLLAPGMVAAAGVLVAAGLLHAHRKPAAELALVIGALFTAFVVESLETVTSGDFGLICLLAVFVLILLPIEVRRTGHAALLLLVSLTTLFAKTTAGMGTTLLLGLAACFFIARKQVQHAANYIAVAAVAALVGWLWFSGGSASSKLTLELGALDLWNVYSQFKEFVLHPRSAVFGCALVILAKRRKAFDPWTNWCVLPSIILFAFGVLLIHIPGYYLTTVPIYWSTGFLSLVALLVAVDLLNGFRLRHLLALLTVGAATGWLWVQSYFEQLGPWSSGVQSTLSVSGIEKLFVYLLSDYAVRLLPVLLLLVAVYVALRFRNKPLIESLSVLLVLSMSFTFGSSLFGSRESYQRDRSWYEDWGFNSQPHATQTLLEVAEYLRRESPRDAIVASNNFCCSGSSWLEDELQLGISDKSYLRSHKDSKWGGANSLLVAYSQRRFLVQSPRFLTGYNYPSEDLQKRLRLSVDFANSPSPELVESLRSYGVSYFIVNLNQTPVRNWEKFGTVLVSNSDFLLLEL